MLPYKERLKLIQYMKAKPHKWLVKVFILSDSLTGHISKFPIYSGDDIIEEDADYGLWLQVAIDLL